MQLCWASLGALQLLIFTGIATETGNKKDREQKQQGLLKTNQDKKPTRNKLLNTEQVVYQTSSFNADTESKEERGHQEAFFDKQANFKVEGKATIVGNHSELKNTTSSLHSNSNEHATVVALGIVLATFGLGSLAVLFACLFYKYRARFNGYQLMTKRNAQKRQQEKHGGKQTDYVTLESISEERLFVENDDSFSDNDLKGYNSKQPRNSTAESNKKSNNFKSNNNDSTKKWSSYDGNTQKDQEGVDSDESSIESDQCSNRWINSSDFKGRFKRSRKWSLQRQCDKGPDNELERSFTIEGNIITTDDKNTFTSEESFIYQVDDDLENSKQLFNYYDEPVKKWKKSKRQSIQANSIRMYNVASDSDDDYELRESMNEQLGTESKIDVAQSNKPMSDSVIYFDYNLADNKSYAFDSKLERPSSGKINEKCFGESSTNDHAERIECSFSEPTIKNKYIIADTLSNTCDADNTSNKEPNSASSSNLSLENEVIQESMKSFEFNVSKHAFNEEISREEMKNDCGDIMLDISSSIYHEGFSNMLRRCSSDSQLSKEMTIKISTSCMNLKSFSTSNLQEVHLMPSPSSSSKAQSSDSPRIKKKSVLQKRLKLFKGLFKKRKKEKQEKIKGRKTKNPNSKQNYT